MAELNFYQQLILVLVGIFVTALVGGIGAVMKMKNQDYEDLKKTVADSKIAIEKNKRCTMLLRKALLLKAQMTDEQIKHDHPKAFHEYERILQEILEDPEDS